MKLRSLSFPQTRTLPPGPGRQSLAVIPRRLRLLHVAIFFAVWITVICSRLFWLQVVRHSEFVERAARQQERTFEVAPRRGILYDRNLHELAMTVLADSVYVVPSEIAAKQEADAPAKYLAVAEALAGVVHTDPTDGFTSARQIAARLHASRNFAWVARKLPPEEIAKVKALNLKGVYFQPEFKRFYPNNQLAAQVLGYVGVDDNGLGGLERGFDRDLHGVPGRMLTALDARRHVLGSQEREPEPGENLVLTIDENIQFIAERALDAALERTHAVSGTVVVQDPNSGQILALAIRPTLNPNNFRHADSRLLRNIAVSNVYEPGSTFKLVAYSAAIDATGVKPDDIVDCQGGQIVLFGRTIHDDVSDRGLGKVTVETALERSSDVGAIKMALRLGKDRFYDYIHAYGFGQRTGIELPAETRGLLRRPQNWGATSIGSIAIGQEVAVTPIQLAAMVSTIANGGVYMPPHILMNSGDAMKGDPQLHPKPFHPENQLPSVLPEGAHRVISELTAAEMRRMMQGTVLNGTGRNAALNGYSSGGKTGTAQKIDVETHRYSKTLHIASFEGIAPVSNPAVSIVVVIDSPKGVYYGAEVSAPVFRVVAQQVLEYLGVPHDRPLQPPSELAKVPVEQADDSPPEHIGDLDALFDSVNNLPADDPLRKQVNDQQLLPTAENELPSDQQANAQTSASVPPLPAASSGTPAQPAKETVATSPSSAKSDTSPNPVTRSLAASTSAGNSGNIIVTDAHHRVAVPSFLGDPVRQAVESAGDAGLSVQVLGEGIARQQVPAPGTMVSLGTEVVVRFSR